MKSVKSLKSFSELSRKIYINDHPKNAHFKYTSNRTHTTKYTLLTFLPKSLYIQFLRIANVYFLFSAIISSIEEVSSVSPVTSIAPLVFVLFTSMLREGIEDWGRHKNDRTINNQKSTVYKIQNDTPNEATVLWEHIHVGDLVKIENNQEIPADILLLTSSDEQGLAYVETANLDGERNLKLKQSKPEIKDFIKENSLSKVKGQMLVEGPNQKIHSFRGIIEIEGLESIYLNYNNLLLRGTHLKNTDYVIGVVVYTGHDSKLLKNQGVFRNKRSRLERQLNTYIIGIFIIQIFLCLLLMGLNIRFRQNNLATADGPLLFYLYPTKESFNSARGVFVDALIILASFNILLNTMIPISLMVSLELAKWFQAQWLEYDNLMWEGDEKIKVLNMLIHEDLAKVEYIFADKTGTLTSNEMKFKFCSIDGIKYSKDQLISGTPGVKSSSQSTEGSLEQSNFETFWTCLGLCHDIVIDTRHDHSANPRGRFQGSSPDEVELVSIASEIDYVFHEKKLDHYVLKIRGELKEFCILEKIEFSSDRKRMSVIAKSVQDEKIYLFCKGADSMIMPRLHKETDLYLLEKTHQHLEMFSKEGLRTLVIGYKEMDEASFAKWKEQYAQAALDEYNVNAEGDHLEKLEALQNEIEQDLTLLGVTALEDKLQEGVPETISDLHKAGIKIWMLTGDKLETAENIGYATNLIAKSTKVFRVKTQDIEKTKLEYQNISNEIKRVMMRRQDRYAQSTNEALGHTPEEYYNSCALIIDGEAISFTFNNDDLKSLFLNLIPEFRTVICCRSTPNQKAEVVTFVKHNLKKVTLAIGDGGNDVNMIQKADIGVGLFGKEGNQAAFASDYAFSRFFFLWRLLLVHGRWFYIRTANFVNFFFYKNIIFTLPQFWFGLTSAFSGQSYYDDGFLTCYNSVFTAVFPVYYATLEQDVNPRENETIRKAMPELYAEFRDKKTLFSMKSFAFWWVIGIIHSVIIYYFVYGVLQTGVNSSGQSLDLWAQSIVTVAGVLCTVFAVLMMGTNHFNVMTFVCFGIFTVLIYFPFGSFILDSFSAPSGGILGDVLSSPITWFTGLMIAVFCACILYIPKQYMSFFHPSLVDLLQRDRNEKWKKEARRKLVSDDLKVTKMQLTPRITPSFVFNNRIMMDGWYKPDDDKLGLTSGRDTREVV